MRGFRAAKRPSAAAGPIASGRSERAGKVYLPPIREVLRENARLRRENVEMRIELDCLREMGGERHG
ncbi:hypothetical protein [Eggerthella timonensis]|uniref:hypothetical protein n=1 Tax=Eggerthella timonensis TaxID=1871008 RepID=UPI000C75A1C5|nr:hypothetical protein [Eggerthella timonensis]